MAELARIKTFKQLLEFLQDQLDWPVDDMDVEDLTFDYDPEDDLGLDPKTAAKVKVVKQLRPLKDGQPFGIFFVEFEPKKLPVTVMRRILGRLVTKKRATANPSDRKTWAKDDLIFASVYGDNDHRRIDFAHFADDADNGLPTLRVLGWDDDDTDRKLDWVEARLKEKLSWPHKETAQEWRLRWRDAFVLRHREAITTSKKLAAELALLAQRIRKRVLQSIRLEAAKGPLRKLHKAFQDSLIHDLNEDRFADMYAQTIAYGLLSARMSRPAGLVADDAALMIPNTNPFLKELMEEFLRIGGRDKKAAGKGGIDFDELGVNDVVELLRSVNVTAVIADFGRERPGEDPVIHFYEYFMEVYDKKEKVKRGVFYTPRPVVSFIVRSVDEILREEFGLPLGLADTTTWGEMAARGTGFQPVSSGAPAGGIQIPKGVKPTDHFVQILDPATGTGTFLVETIDLIHRRMVEHWQGQKKSKSQIEELWNEYVPEHLLPRLYGFELMMAPYAIAHMKIGLKLADTGYRFRSEQRLRVFLTNSLEPPLAGRSLLGLPGFLAHETYSADQVKTSLPATVVVGNPPYSQYSANLTAEARSFVDRFRYANGTRIKARNAIQLERNLNDDYVKFFGLALGFEAARTGAICLITNRMFLDSDSLLGLREALATDRPMLSTLDLNGDMQRSRLIPRLAGDKNVFDIAQGVAVTLRAAVPQRPGLATTGGLVGSREQKFAALERPQSELCRITTGPNSPDWWVSERFHDDAAVPRLPALLPLYAGLVASNRDHLVVQFDQAELAEVIEPVLQFGGSDAAFCSKFGLTEKANWNIAAARRRLRQVRAVAAFAEVIEYRPFDRRAMFFHRDLVWQSSPMTSRHLGAPVESLLFAALGKNRGETVGGQWVFRRLADKSVVSGRDNASGFPLFLTPVDGEREVTPVQLADTLAREIGKAGPITPEDRRSLESACRRLYPAEAYPRLPTFDPRVLESLSRRWSRTWSPEGFAEGDRFGPEGLAASLYAVFYAPSYRARYRAELMEGFPVVALPVAAECFDRLAGLGADLFSLHLLEEDYPYASWAKTGRARSGPHSWPIATFHDSGDREVLRVGEKGKTMAPSPKGPGFGRVYINDSACFDGVPEAVWKFHIGGYQVCHKWLADRKGRTLSDDDIAHYHKIVIALNETIRIMGEIDKVIEEHGGWPGAFVTEPQPSGNAPPPPGAKEGPDLPFA